MAGRTILAVLLFIALLSQNRSHSHEQKRAALP